MTVPVKCALFLCVSIFCILCVDGAPTAIGVDVEADIPDGWKDLLGDSFAHTNNDSDSLLANRDLFEGDIKVIPIDAEHPGGSGGTLFHTAVRNRNVLWSNGVVPFTIGRGYDSGEQSIIINALNNIMRKTCIQFVWRTNQKDYITFVKSGRGCSSYIARSGGQQFVNLSDGCVTNGIVQHETMHALGFDHEQSRNDREKFVTINWKNIDSNMKYNFQIDNTDSLGLPYDYGSVMHYEWNAFAINRRRPTIVPKRKATIGQRVGVSDNDIKKINLLYRCQGAKSPVIGSSQFRPSGRRSDDDSDQIITNTNQVANTIEIYATTTLSPKRPKSSATSVTFCTGMLWPALATVIANLVIR